MVENVSLRVTAKTQLSFPSYIVYITGYSFNCDSCWILVILQHCLGYSKDW